MSSTAHEALGDLLEQISEAEIREAQRWDPSNAARARLVTEAEWNRIMVEQDGRCPICSCVLVDPCADHDHVSGRFRGIICGLCNSGLGMFKDNEEALRRAIKYLEDFRNAGS